MAKSDNSVVRRVAEAVTRSRRSMTMTAVIVLLMVMGLFRDRVAKLPEMMCAPPVTAGSEATQRGRHDSEFPSPRCCVDEECLAGDRGRYAVLTTLRTNMYLTLVEHLACSLQKSNPNITLLVATVEGDLSKKTLERLGEIKNIKVHYWKEFRVENKLRERFALNWVKIRAWEMEEFDAVLMLDGDTLVEKSLDTLWKLPAHFAAVHDQDKLVPRFSSMGRMQGGVVFLRPCKAVAEHMMHLVSTNETLQFANSHAEQSFFDWYFRWDRWMLPAKYNAIAPMLEKQGEMTPGGTNPVIVHYARAKPYALTPDLHHEQRIALCN